MLCFKCLKNIPDKSARCPHCGQNFAGKSAANANADRGALLKEGDKVGQYAIRELVGEGPMGRVYKVLDTQFDVLAALKILHPEFSKDRAIKNTTINVFRSLSEFDADQFVKIYDAGEAEDKVFIATDYLEGLSLKRLMEVRAGSGSKFGWEEAEPIIDAVCTAIESMNPGEVHGDIKPENIVILPDAVKLTDLGLSRIAAPDTFVTAQVVGGSGYMAPELATHADRLRTDPAVDVYALGAGLYQLLTGSLPTPDAISPIARVPEVPPEISKIVEKALQAHPDQRFNHVAEMHLDIARFTGKVETLARVEIFLHDLAPRHPFEEIIEEVVAPPPPPPPPAPKAAPQAPQVAPAPQAKAKSLFDDELMGEGKDSKKVAAAAPAPSSKAPLVAVIGAVVLALVGGGVFLATRSEPPAPVSSAPAAAPKVAAKTATPVQEKAVSSVTKEKAQDALVRAEKSRDDAISVNAAKGAPELFVVGMKFLREANDAMRADGYAQAVSLSVSAEQAFSDAIIKGVSGSQSKAADKEKSTKSGDETEKQAVAAPAKKERCPAGTIFIASGPFIMGASSGDPDRNPGEKYNEVVKVAGFCIDKYEFPNKQGAMPMGGVNWSKAKQQCEAVSKRLCSEEEWEKACKGPKNLKYPYASSYDAAKCNTEDAKGDDRPLAASGALAACVSGFGVADMSGNLWEWTSSQLQPNLQDRVLRGGSYSRPDYHDRCANRYNSLPSVISKEFGFRCCTIANE